MGRLLEAIDHDRNSPVLFILVALALLGIIGVVDYLTGYQVLFSVFYLLEVGIAAWFVGRGFGLLMSVLSVVVWMGGDLAAGARYSNSFVPIWNSVILLTFYCIVVLLLTRVRALQRELELRVRERTRDLREEMAERRRLEREILSISEREQRRIGHELHDGLCQHLTATALAGQVLTERLGNKAVSEAADARKVVDLVEQGISLARDFARGLYPVEMEAEGLMAAFQELADQISRTTKIRCVFECTTPVLIHDDGAATHLFRIAQEAVANAMRHAKASRIGVSLVENSGQVTLTIEDNGEGLPENLPAGRGLGLRIMAYRATMIGGSFSIEPAPTGGTIVTCTFPTSPGQSQVPEGSNNES